MKDNPNPHAHIGFICYYPLQFYVYKNIYAYLPNAEFVVDDAYRVFGYEFPDAYHERLFTFFGKQNVYWRKISVKDNAITREEFFSKYDLLVNTLYYKTMDVPYIRDKKLVRVMYGYAKNLWNFGPWSAYFDKVLSYGPYAQQFLSIYGNSVVVGNPKFDGWFSEKKRTQTTRPKDSVSTVLYMPTWGTLSSIAHTVSAVHELSSEYRFIIKVHHMTSLLSPELIAPFKNNKRLVLVDDTVDVVPLLKEADVVISDNSGGIFEAILTDKPVVLLNTTDDIPQKSDHLFYVQQGKHVGASTSTSSFEQQIRRPEQAVGPIVRTNHQPNAQFATQTLREALQAARAQEHLYAPRRKHIRDSAFAYMDGSAGERAAREITTLLHAPKPERNFLAESIDLYVRDFFIPRVARKGDAELAELGERFNRMKQLPYWERMWAVLNAFF